MILEQAVLAKNDALAARNRAWLESQRVLALNVMSSPGSGKTTLLARTIVDLHANDPEYSIAVVEGDQETLLDARRIAASGARVTQVNTGAGCHLDAEMFRPALDDLAPELGVVACSSRTSATWSARRSSTSARQSEVVVISVTEGDDKPLKYPHMFRTADLVVVNKSDLLPYVDFDVARCIAAARSVQPGVEHLLVSATTGAGLDDWYDWLARARAH